MDIFITFVEGCFPSVAKVKVENGKLLAMSELQIGDKVQTGKANITFRKILSGIIFLNDIMK